MKKKNISLILGIFFVAIIIFLFLLSFVYLPYSVDQMDTKNRFSPPSSSHLLGTDQFGRDIFSRILVSTRSALAVSTSSVLMGTVFGLLLGALAALSPHFIESILMRFVDAMMAFPGILSAMVLSAVLG